MIICYSNRATPLGAVDAGRDADGVGRRGPGRFFGVKADPSTRVWSLGSWRGAGYVIGGDVAALMALPLTALASPTSLRRDAGVARQVQ